MINIDKSRLNAIFATFRQKKVLVLGDLMLDEYLSGTVSRISPEAPVPVIDIEEQVARLGGAANVALNVAHLGCEPVLAGVVGEDRTAETFLNLIRENKLSSEGVLAVKSRPTTVKTRVIGDAQHIARIDKESKEYLDIKVQERLITFLDEQVQGVDAIILQDYNKGVLTAKIIQHVIKLANQETKLITVDPKFTNFLKYESVSLFKPNIKETEEALAMQIHTDDELIDAGKKLMQRLKAESILITRGAKGMSLFERGGDITHISTRAKNIADVSGAGDTVISTLTASVLGGASYKEAATLANHAAGIVCGEVGILPVDAEKLYKACLE